MEEKPGEKAKIIKLMSHPTFKERWALANLIPGHPLKGPSKEEMFYLRQTVKQLQEAPPEPSRNERKKRLRVLKNQEAKKQEKEEPK